MIKNACLLIVLAVSAIGCASGVAYSDYRTTLKPIPEDHGRVWFYRPSKMVGAAVQPKVHLTTEPTEGKEDTSGHEWQVVGKAQAGAYFVVDRAPGIYGVKCTTEWKNERTVEFVKGEERYMRMTIAPGLFVGHILVGEATTEKAEKEIKKLKLLDGEYPNQ